jgi:hypothetical protein
MDTQLFKITRIEGEYAYLAPVMGGEEIFIALALLPLGADIGQLLAYENFEFRIAE